MVDVNSCDAVEQQRLMPGINVFELIEIKLLITDYIAK